jgi:pullulanase
MVPSSGQGAGAGGRLHGSGVNGRLGPGAAKAEPQGYEEAKGFHKAEFWRWPGYIVVMNFCTLLRHALFATLLIMSGAHAHDTAPSLADCDKADFAHTLQAAAVTDLPASAYWMHRAWIRWPGEQDAGGRYWLVHSRSGQLQAEVGQRISGDDHKVALAPSTAVLPTGLSERFKFVAVGVTLRLPVSALAQVPTWLRGQVWLVATDAAGLVQRSAALQSAGVLDDVYAPAAAFSGLGVGVDDGSTRFTLWAPTAQNVVLCLHRSGDGAASQLLPMRRDQRTGSWSARLTSDLTGSYYTYLVDVFVPSVGRVRNRVTDPYSLSLTTDSLRTWVGSLNSASVTPAGWASTPRPNTVQANTDLVIYELHVRDFSVQDSTVSRANRGKYLAFTESASNGMRHLQKLAQTGVTDVHLLPVFDIASVPEKDCVTADISGTANSESQQAQAMAGAATDCFNWGYDPYHFTAPEGSYASNPADGAVRIIEFRRMVQALHRAGLRVGMDMVYNHTTASGQKLTSVLDRIVPGYYQRLNALGAVETSSCCDNTATEHKMMAKLMIDSAVVWARGHHIDSMRFDLMGHQPRAVMEQLQAAVNKAAGRHIHLIGEGWNFGEVADGKRFVQASQNSLNDSGIATFSDRGRDALRGGGCCDDAAATLSRQGWLNGQFYDVNSYATQAGVATAQDLQRNADLVRVGLAGTLRNYTMTTFDGSVKALGAIDYAGLGAGYASQPGEVVNYVENHDNPTLFDINVLKLPAATSSAERARVQVLGLAVTAFSQGVAYFHAGIEALRSKNMDRNSFDSGDHFNRLDWTFSDNHFGSGLPPAKENGGLWEVMKPLLADANIKPSAADIRFTRDAFFDLLKIRRSSSLFRLRSADEVSARLRFHNTGLEQRATCVVGQLDGRNLPDAGFKEVLYAVNVDTMQVVLTLPALQGKRYVLHPAHLAAGAADKRPAASASWDAANATLTVPARTALVYVVE